MTRSDAVTRGVRFDTYGASEVLEVVLLDPPVAEGEIVIEVRAAGVNPVDSKILSGRREGEPIRKPRGLGSDAAGGLTAIGAGVTGFEIGDDVVERGLTGAFESDMVGESRLFARKSANGLLERVRAAAPRGSDDVLEAAGTREAIEVSVELVAD